MKILRALSIAAVALAPTPAFAAESGVNAPGAGAGLSVLETVGLFVLAPLSIYGVIWLLWSIPKWRRDAPSTGENWNPHPGR